VTRRDHFIFRFAGITLIILGAVLAIIDKDPLPFRQPFDTIMVGVVALAISYLEERRQRRK
jgi:hypothetical protein